MAIETKQGEKLLLNRGSGNQNLLDGGGGHFEINFLNILEFRFQLGWTQG